MTHEIKVGQRYKDNDPRSSYPGRARIGTVEEVDASCMSARLFWNLTKRRSWVSFKRLRSSGRTGYTLLQETSDD